ncbi:MAG: hypothetical protein K2N27_00780 [Ruminococcus sp.]|nr:hypothetical protein [Ruminococcus sp.]
MITRNFIENSAVHAMQVFQQNMKGEAENTGLESDEDIMTLISEMRKESQLLNK